jgi:hypothetical protein
MKRGPRKLTPERLAKIAELRARDVSQTAIAKAVGVSVGSVNRAFDMLDAEREREPQAPQAPPTPLPEPELDTPPTLEQLRLDIAAQVRALQGDADRARASGDDQSLARAQRHQASLSIVLARLTREGEVDDATVRLPKTAIDDAAAQFRLTLHRLIDAELERAGESP